IIAEMRLALLLSSLLYISSTMHRHQRNRIIQEEEIGQLHFYYSKKYAKSIVDYEEDDEDDEDDYEEEEESLDSNEEIIGETPVAIAWVPVINRNLSGTVFAEIQSADREEIRQISEYLNYSLHKSRDASISSFSFTFLPLSFPLLLTLLR
ncbi:hypothetical protein PENTCL1PPCAC_22478, partial [Pristionchus entomophagus]